MGDIGPVAPRRWAFRSARCDDGRVEPRTELHHLAPRRSEAHPGEPPRHELHTTGLRTRIRLLAVGAALTAGLAMFAAACGGGDDEAPTGSLTAMGSGEQIARRNGCAGCHGPNFGGASGPGWIGLAGSEIELDDGTTVIADEAYLTRAITDPSAERRDGYSLKMPANNLSDAEVADVVAYIQSLADG